MGSLLRSSESKQIHAVTVLPEGSGKTDTFAGSALHSAINGTTLGKPRARWKINLCHRFRTLRAMRQSAGPSRTEGTGTVAKPSNSGGYAQVASERNPADAHAVFRMLRAKFPNHLGGRQPIVSRTRQCKRRLAAP
jgi:hypothetical protein